MTIAQYIYIYNRSSWEAGHPPPVAGSKLTLYPKRPMNFKRELARQTLKLHDDLLEEHLEMLGRIRRFVLDGNMVRRRRITY